jgi:hypothetical protein
LLINQQRRGRGSCRSSLVPHCKVQRASLLNKKGGAWPPSEISEQKTSQHLYAIDVNGIAADFAGNCYVVPFMPGKNVRIIDG